MVGGVFSLGFSQAEHCWWLTVKCGGSQFVDRSLREGFNKTNNFGRFINKLIIVERIAPNPSEPIEWVCMAKKETS